MEKEKNIDNLDFTETNDISHEVSTETTSEETTSEETTSEETTSEEEINEVNEEEYIPSEEDALLFKLHKIEVEMERIENTVNQINAVVSDELMEEYNDLKTQHKELRLELKNLKKTEKTVLDKIPIWMYIYGIIVLTLFFPVLSLQIWVSFSSFLIELFAKPLDSVYYNAPVAFTNFLIVLIIYALPLLSFFITWVVYSIVIKKAENKKYFSYIWMGQTVLTIIMCVWLYFDYVRGIWR